MVRFVVIDVVANLVVRPPKIDAPHSDEPISRFAKLKLLHLLAPKSPAMWLGCVVVCEFVCMSMHFVSESNAIKKCINSRRWECTTHAALEHRTAPSRQRIRVVWNKLAEIKRK